MKTVYQNTKKLKGNYSQHHDLPVRDEDETHVTVEENKLKRWKQSFESILHCPDPPVLADIPEAEEDLDINFDNITIEEVKQAIHKLKNGKVPGDDGVCPEMLKAEETATPQLLCHILQKIWDSEKAPNDCKTGIIVKLPKEGDLGNCNNWQGIALQSLSSKIFSRIILQHITAAVDSILRQEQAGFRKSKSCINHIFILRQILEESHEWNGSLYVVFVDFKKAFDTNNSGSISNLGTADKT